MDDFFNKSRSLKEIAHHFGVSTSTMKRWIVVAGINKPDGRRLYTIGEMQKIKEFFA